MWEQKSNRSCLASFKDSKWSPWVVRHALSPWKFKVIHCSPHPQMALSMTKTWAKIYPLPPHLYRREVSLSNYTLEKLCRPHPGRGNQAYWTKGRHLIQGTPGHWLGLDLSGPGFSRWNEPIRYPFARLIGDCSLVRWRQKGLVTSEGQVQDELSRGRGWRGKEGGRERGKNLE